MENKSKLLPCGVRVIDIQGDDKPYKLNEEALSKILLRDDVADCVVSVVSVAGPCRGGKSFLLDYMLRYLHADEKARRDESWAGEPTQPLDGFSWRGGGDRDTVGLLLWSQPIHMVLPSGQSVVVLLVDTQGSFDNCSTVRDSSTFFALSTLLSSIQIYNLLNNIMEDDLQHLQLFTEYGRMASESSDSVKPFQNLMFLVRDWAFEYEHPYGIEGGQQLLKKRLQVNKEQAKELQDVRRHIHDCFLTAQGFLMPHPGFAISDSNFKGCLSDLRPEFKTSLLQLIPLILAPENLQPKQINGEIIKARDLCHFFKTYVEVFNSDELPQPQSIMRATSEAGLLSVVESARNLYRQKLERVCAIDAPCVSHVVLREIHELTCREVMEIFRQKKVMIDQQTLQSRGDQLQQELDSQFQLYELINEGKIQKLRGNAKRVYDEIMQAASHSNQNIPFCFHPKDLEEMHRSACNTAMQPFDFTTNDLWRFSENIEDEHRNSLLKELEERYNQLRALNDSNNNAALSEAREDYFSYIESACGDLLCMSDQRLEKEHEDAFERALEIFQSIRIRHFNHSEDFYKSLLGKEIEHKFGKIQRQNKKKKEANAASATAVYRDRMAALVAPDLAALHPLQLEQEHYEVIESAKNEFYSKRQVGKDIEEVDEYITRVVEEAQRHYITVCSLNENNNILAISSAYSSYCSSMDNVCGIDRMKISVDALEAAHEYAHRLALRIFYDKRLGNNEYVPDTHKENLIEKITERLEYYREINMRNPEPQQSNTVARLNTIDSSILVGGLIAATMFSGGSALAIMAGETLMAGSLATAAASTSAAVFSIFARIRGRPQPRRE